MRPTTASILIWGCIGVCKHELEGNPRSEVAVLRRPSRVARVPLTPADIAPEAHQLLAEGYGLFLASNGPVLAQLETVPLGVPVTPLDFLSPGQHMDDSW